MIIDNKFNIGDMLYLVTDEEQKLRICTAIKISPNSQILYEMSYGSSTSNHYEFELSKEENVLLKTK